MSNSVKTPMSWSDETFDYFRTSDGKVVSVQRDFVREAAEAEWKRSKRRVMLMNWAARCLIAAFTTAGIVVLAFLILLRLRGAL